MHRTPRDKELYPRSASMIVFAGESIFPSIWTRARDSLLTIVFFNPYICILFIAKIIQCMEMELIGTSLSIERGSYPERISYVFLKNQYQGEGQKNPSEVLIQK